MAGREDLATDDELLFPLDSLQCCQRYLHHGSSVPESRVGRMDKGLIVDVKWGECKRGNMY